MKISHCKIFLIRQPAISFGNSHPKKTAGCKKEAWDVDFTKHIKSLRDLSRASCQFRSKMPANNNC